jgi:fructose-1,6-bisphosphatase
VINGRNKYDFLNQILAVENHDKIRKTQSNRHWYSAAVVGAIYRVMIQGGTAVLSVHQSQFKTSVRN